EMKLCRIEKIVLNNDENSSVTFRYNTCDDPVSIREDSTILTMPLDYYFRYDGQRRLTDYIITYYHMPGAMLWHHYAYPDKKTIMDTQFNYTGLLTDPEPPRNAASFYVNKYTLDAQGRIVRNFSYYSQSTQDYAYDSRGNLVRPGIQYDNKVSILRTNRVWMLVNKDYSINNPLPTTATIDNYNQYGLPTQYTTTAGWQDNQLFGYYYYRATVQYACDISRLPAK
ncbi:MAG: hypothetical protein JST39_00145, partial [Bacteroidetes bacterium]|nr:hypothetical protein [Bacteroidota bacterium]